jgi:glutamate racemase
LTAVPCPDLAPIIQGGEEFDHGLIDIVRGYCRPLREANVDTVILGCTHYPLVRPLLQRMLGPGVELVTSGAALARQVGHALASRGLAHPGEPDREGDYRFLTTGDVESFRALGTRFLQMPLGEIEHIDLASSDDGGRAADLASSDRRAADRRGSTEPSPPPAARRGWPDA